ncbi:MAG: hypothetical protein CMO06_09025 [Thalassospira sp.]|uniref:hypothetical protein n=1 Tax=Thalassospira sp. TaxID=1912094 RepID=UPI000C567CE2|nr:hypothetical protein [Thalassospira sp.]MAZ33274.1 hypothetical protein [Thalassospira sp.]|tara:strand:+ start:763 stop:1245 length:483 start_codon:yes stop_codon:yes gene_type:complete
MTYVGQFKSIAKPLLIAGSTVLVVTVLNVTAAAAKPIPMQAAPRAEIAQSNGFSEQERRVILDVLDAVDQNVGGDDDRGRGFKNKGNGKGKDGLPPGIAMKLERGGTLPPGIAKRDLPADLRSRLPYRSDAIRQIVGSDVVLIEKGTDIILDVIRDVVRN